MGVGIYVLTKGSGGGSREMSLYKEVSILYSYAILAVPVRRCPDS